MPDPVLYTFMNDNYPGWWTSPEKEELEAKFTGTTDPEERKQLWTDIQGLLYEQVPVVKVGDVFPFHIASPQIEGLPEQLTMFWPVFWNAHKS
jgi:peptide/nickel transport system substrate-binding protein